jgi:hypothetical protein
MSYYEQNDYQNLNGAKPVADAGKKLAQKGGQKAKQIARKGAEKLVKKIVSTSLKKLAGGLLLKTAPIWGGILALILVILLSVSIFIPSISADRVKTYSSVSSDIGGLSANLLLAFNTALYESEDLDEINPNDSAYYFMRLSFEQFGPEHYICLKLDPKDPAKCLEKEKVPEEIIVSLTVQGKEKIKKFFRDKGQPTDNIKKALKGLRSMQNVRVSVTNLTPEVAMEQAGFTDVQKEYFYEILESGLMDEEYQDLGLSFGIGAVCAPNKELDQAALKQSFLNAGVFSKYQSKFVQIAEKNRIDPVIMIAIAFHETGYGTSSAVVNKNNPGGLMNPDGSGLFVFPTLNDGLESMGRTLHNRIIKDGKTTINLLGSVYAPVGAGNDPNGLNAHWVPNITKIVQDLGGLTINCEANALPNMDGISSESAKMIAVSGYLWINNSEYVFGGGRKQSDIDNGWFDCSSFVHWAYKQGGVELGTLSAVSTETLNMLGKKITLSEIQVGDLVFWDTYKKDGHVGIYVGSGKFIGAQSSTGVAIVNLDNSYWKSKFSGHVRRILP